MLIPQTQMPGQGAQQINPAALLAQMGLMGAQTAGLTPQQKLQQQQQQALLLAHLAQQQAAQQAALAAVGQPGAAAHLAAAAAASPGITEEEGGGSPAAGQPPGSPPGGLPGGGVDSPIQALPSFSQLDPSVLDALPLALKRELERAYGEIPGLRTVLLESSRLLRRFTLM